MEKILTVCRAAQGKKYTNAISIKGEYLKKYGFLTGDFVKVTIQKGEIIIKNDVSTQMLTAMKTKNPHLLTLIENIDLVIM